MYTHGKEFSVVVNLIDTIVDSSQTVQWTNIFAISFFVLIIFFGLLKVADIKINWFSNWFLTPATITFLLLLFLFVEIVDADPKGRENSRRVSAEIARCIDNNKECVGGVMYARDGRIIPIDDGIVRMLSFWYGYQRGKLIKQIERIEYRKQR